MDRQARQNHPPWGSRREGQRPQGEELGHHRKARPPVGRGWSPGPGSTDDPFHKLRRFQLPGQQRWVGTVWPGHGRQDGWVGTRLLGKPRRQPGQLPRASPPPARQAVPLGGRGSLTSRSR